MLSLNTYMFATGTPFVRIMMECTSYPNTSIFTGKCDYKLYTPDEDTFQFIDFTGRKGNSMGGYVYRLDDSDDFKEWELHISKPPKACLSTMGCTQTQADDCNGQ